VRNRLDPSSWFLTYEQGVTAFRVTDRLSDTERAALMGETLTRVYNWSPSKT
jgi:L-fuconolactonase